MALDLDSQAFGADASWPTLLARRIVSKKAPGLIPKKLRPAPANVMGSDPAFDRLVAIACGRKWLATDLMEAAILPTYRPRLFRARQ